MKKKAILMVCVFFLIACILFFTKGTLAQTNVIKVGVLAPLSGWGAEMGIPMKEGIELYFNEANASGKFGNKKVELIIFDDEGSASKGPLVARKLIFIDNVQVILGSTASAVTTGLVAIQDEFKTPFIVPVPQAPSITRPPKHWFFRTTSDNVTDMELLIRYIKKKGYKKPALFYHTTAYGLEFKELAEPAFKEAGIPIVASETHPLTPVNLVPQALKLKNADPDVLLSWSVGQPTALFAIAMRKQLNWDIPLIGGRGLAFPLLIEQGGDSVEGTVLTDAVQFDKPAAKAFIEKYEKKLGKKAYGGLSFAACGYDAAYLLGHVIEKLVKTGKEINKVTIRDAIESVEKLPSQAAGGEGSYYSFNANRHQGASPDWPILNIVKNGQYVNLKW